MTATLEHISDVREFVRGIPSKELQRLCDVGFIPRGQEQIYEAPEQLASFATAHGKLREHKKSRGGIEGRDSWLLTTQEAIQGGTHQRVSSMVGLSERTTDGYNGESIDFICLESGEKYVQVHTFVRSHDPRIDDIITGVQPVSERPDLLNQCRILINAAELLDTVQTDIAPRLGNTAILAS